ncbi:hypothetical protein [Undibacterium sp. TJN19]|uniref:hypothetical protein n=1 Tax=Undibacterium sp. TJN19 TaxID=3413055 RepID=UPI003BF153E3
MNIAQIIQSAKQAEQVIIGLSPTVGTLVADAAKTFGLDSTTNEQKLQHVQDRLGAIWQFAGEAGDDFQKVWPLLSVVVTGIVKANNIGGRWGQAIAALDVVATAL